MISASQAAAKASVAGGEPDNGSNTNGQGGAGSQQVDSKTKGQKTFADGTASSEASKAKSGTTTKGTEGDASPSASTSSGTVSVAGAVAVNIEHGSSIAYVGDTRQVTASGGALSVKSSANVDGTALADGSATIGEKEFDAATAVDQGQNTINLGAGSGLSNGAQVTYFQGNGGTAIGGLTDDANYYVYDTGGGKFRLYKVQTDAQAGNGNYVQFTSQGTGSMQALRGAGAGGDGVGVAVAVNYAQQTNLAYVGAATINAQGLDIEATQADRTLTFDPNTKVDTIKNTIDVGQSGLRTGDAVVYHQSGASAIAGLTDGTKYYVNVQDDGTLKLYDTQDHAVAGGTIGLEILSSVAGTGAADTLVDATDSFGAWATSGAGGGNVGVAGSLAINIAFTDTEADAGYSDDHRRRRRHPEV